ncbi:Acyl-CoA dehydrogenase [Planctomycetes bacterium Poly30]|uniref:Cyclohex-1-ene-1-carbonyl-CoA dehydrogenase n=1 Tax=Saltatorellus ferox TaxID=2528018 RepID=A0A518EY59_9BACT|nr:Acyl-CoA dehydrogenase [Planctomycetes bacterium Poly30]
MTVTDPALAATTEGLNFDLGEELSLVRDEAKKFADDVLLPLATKHDREAAISDDVYRQIGELGFWGLTIPEEYGGAGMNNQALAVVLEELNRACAATGVAVSVHNSLLCAPLMKFGTEAQKQYWLPKLSSGEAIGAYSLSEAGSGSDAAALSATATKEGDEWVLSGTKLWVTSGDRAGLILIYVRTDQDAPKAKGISAFLVPGDAPGLKVGKHEKKTGIRGSATVELILDNLRLKDTDILGEVNRGFPIAMDTLAGGRIGIASQAVGIGQACLDASIKYSMEREQFGKPIGHFQAIQHKIADMSTRLEASRLLVQKAAWMRDRGMDCNRQASEAKLFASQTSNYCADEALQIHGGAGYTDHFHVERLFRDARITEIYEGATDIQRLVIARALLR